MHCDASSSSYNYKRDVLGVGQAMVDLHARATTGHISRLGVEKGSRNLVSVAERTRILEHLDYSLSAGGSLSNTLIDLAKLVKAANDAHSLRSNGVAFAGLVGNDALGKYYRAEMGRVGVHVVDTAASMPSSQTTASSRETGTVAVLTDETADRTLFSYLGTQSEISVCKRMEDAIENTSVLVLEGYLFELPEARRTVLAAIAAAKRHGVRVAMTAGDAGVVVRHGERMWECIRAGVDILFTNAAEATALAKCRPVDASHTSQYPLYHSLSPATSQAEAAALCLGPHCPGLVCVTDGSRGSVVVGVGEMRRVPPVWKPEAPVDTTGAGDAWCAGFLFGLLYQGGDIADLGRIAARSASAVISHDGPTLTDADARAVVRQERESGRERVEGGVKRFSRERGQTYLNS